MAKEGPRKKVPKELAVINADNCTGCESCLEVCPVDCIELKKIDRGAGEGQYLLPVTNTERSVDLDLINNIIATMAGSMLGRVASRRRHRLSIVP